MINSTHSQVIAKDQATMDHLKESVGSNVLFQHLEEDELRDVLDAMYGTDDIFWGSLLRPVLAPPHSMP